MKKAKTTKTKQENKRKRICAMLILPTTIIYMLKRKFQHWFIFTDNHYWYEWKESIYLLIYNFVAMNSILTSTFL